VRSPQQTSDEERELTSSVLARLNDQELRDLTDTTSRRIAALTGRLVLLAGELDRREAWRAEGASSLDTWLAERTGVSRPTARAQAHVAERLFDLPHLAQGLVGGEISFDKVRAVVDTTTPETDADMAARARELTVRQLSELTRATNRKPPSATEDYERRSVRFNDACTTMTAQLPTDAYAEVKALLESEATQVASDGETPWDQRLADGLLSVLRSGAAGTGTRRGSSYVVVAHVPLATLLDEDSNLPAELEGAGLVNGEVIRRLACDATLVVAADDDAGHTMYEGRQQRYPTATQRREITRRDRHCRFPGCTHSTFVHPHHIKRWKPDRGPTDLDNLVTLCDLHHHLVHSSAWTLSGDANEELHFRGPSGRVMSSRPSPLWTVVTASFTERV
jgi:hypothetical protein